MKKAGVWLRILAGCLFLTGCTKGETEPRRLRDLDFTVVSEEKLPEELNELIEAKKEQPFKLTYMDNGWLYVAEGYGTQNSGGYSICVNDFFEAENALYVDTTLLGPQETDVQGVGHSFPYIVLKTEAIDKNVVFQ